MRYVFPRVGRLHSCGIYDVNDMKTHNWIINCVDFFSILYSALDTLLTGRHIVFMVRSCFAVEASRLGHSSKQRALHNGKSSPSTGKRIIDKEPETR